MSEREDRRQLVHLAMTGCALALRWLTPTEAALCAGAAIVLNWVALPLLGMDMRRPDEPFVGGVRMYPVAVLGLVLLLPLPLAAAAWGVLGVGDAASNLVGRRWGRTPLLGREDRTLVGTAAFVLLAAPASLALWAFVGRSAPTVAMGLSAAGAAAAGALAELIPRRRWLDDNLPIAIAAGATLYALAP